VAGRGDTVKEGLNGDGEQIRIQVNAREVRCGGVAVKCAALRR